MEQRLGFGRDGTVFASSAATAVKSFGDRETFERELACYIRLTEHGVIEVGGHHVPQLLDFEEALLVIEMTIVKPPFLLDFASAYLDVAPDFSPEVLENWVAEKSEQFGPRWAAVQNVLEMLVAQYGIHLLDIHQANITFRGEIPGGDVRSH